MATKETKVEEKTSEKEFSEFVIKEVMIQKNIDRDAALKVLKNP